MLKDDKRTVSETKKKEEEEIYKISEVLKIENEIVREKYLKNTRRLEMIVANESWGTNHVTQRYRKEDETKK